MPELQVGLLGALGLVVFAAGISNGAVGFGFAQLAAAIFGLLVDPKVALVLLSIMVPVTSTVQIVKYRRALGSAGRIRSLFIGGLLGVPLGVALLAYLPTRALALTLGVFTILFVLSNFRKVPLRLPPEREWWAAPLVGLTSGVCNGTVGVSGPVLGSYLLALDVPAATFAFTIALMFSSMSVVRLASLATTGALTPQLLGLGLGLLPPALLGQQVGYWLQGRISRETFRRAVLGLLLVAGLGLIRRGIEG